MKTMSVEEFAALNGKTIQTLLSLQDLLLTRDGKSTAVATALDVTFPEALPAKNLKTKKSKSPRWAHKISKIGQGAIGAAAKQYLKTGRSIVVMKEGWLVRIGPR